MTDCCKSWKRATQVGSDNEGYSSAITPAVNAQDVVTIGLVDDPVKFCPWCGAAKAATIDEMCEAARGKA